VSVVALSASFGVSVALLVAADDTSFVVHRAGGWPASSASASSSTGSPG
jgi:hypothetical protein